MKSDFINIYVRDDIVDDVINITTGAYFPLEGFMGLSDLESVLKEMRLSGGEVWSIPIVLDIDEETKEKIGDNRNLNLLRKSDSTLIGFCEDVIVYEYDKDKYANCIFGTNDINHPGVAHTKNMGRYLVGGRVFESSGIKELYPTQYLSPEKTKEFFNNKGWKSVSAFQTRNIPHRGHEYIQKHALSITDGLLIHPVIGEKKKGDFKNDCIIRAYNVFVENYHNKSRVCMSTLPLRMRYAGPREALFHALVRRNFGCTHCIIGRDHAGVNGYYKPNSAQDVFMNFSKEELGIEIIPLEEVVYDIEGKVHSFSSNVLEENRRSFSGTKLRYIIQNGGEVPEYIIRKEVYDEVLRYENPFI